jgi:hypothetical protein
MGIVLPGTFALAHGMVPFLFLHQAIWQWKRRHDFEFLKTKILKGGDY